MKRLLLLLSLVLCSAFPALAQENESPESLHPWTAWTPLGGQITSDPAACTIGNWTYVVARGTDNGMWYRRRYLPTGLWDGWRRIPGTLRFSGSPSAACLGTNQRPQFEVTAVGQDSRLWRAYALAESWVGWHLWRDSAQFGTGPAQAAIGFPSYFHNHFVRGTDSTVYHRYFFGGNWSNWTSVSPVVTADPAAVVRSPSTMDLVVRWTDGSLIHRIWSGGIWNPFYFVGGGIVTSSPDIVSRDPSSLDLFVRGQGNALWHKRWINGVWGGYVNLGGNLTSGPGATTYANNARMMVFARWSDGSLYYRAWAP